MTRQDWIKSLEIKGYSFNALGHHAKDLWRAAVYGKDGALLTSVCVLTMDQGARHEGIAVFWCGETNCFSEDVEHLERLEAKAVARTTGP